MDRFLLAQLPSILAVARTKSFAKAAAELGVDIASFGDRFDRSAWPRQAELLAKLFRTKPRDHWAQVFAATDACVTPVLDLAEAPHDEHLRERGTFQDRDGVPMPAPAPRFARARSTVGTPPRRPGQDGLAVLRELRYGEEEARALVEQGVVRVPEAVHDNIV